MFLCPALVTYPPSQENHYAPFKLTREKERERERKRERERERDSLRVVEKQEQTLRTKTRYHRKEASLATLSPFSSLFSSHLSSVPLYNHPLFLSGKNAIITRPTIAARMPVSSNARAVDSKCSLSHLAPLEAILFDIDGTLCDSDPIHYYAFREMLQEVGFNGGVPITEDFFAGNISGKHNEDISAVLFPEWDHEKAMKFMDDKEAMYRRLAPQHLKAVNGLHKLCKWIEDRGYKRAAVTNAPRANAELMISLLGLSDFFHFLVIGGECERAKPFPDPYLKALEDLKASPEHTFVFEDSASGIKAGVAAGMPVVGIATRNPEQLLMDSGATFLVKDFEDPKLLMALEELEISATRREGVDV